MIKLKKLINESTWDRKFGEPLPTLTNVMEKHNDCGCGGHNTCECKIKESTNDVVKGKKKLQSLMKKEASFRLTLWELVTIMSKDKVNKSLADDVSKLYKKNVTNFMRDAVKAVKGMK